MFDIFFEIFMVLVWSLFSLKMDKHFPESSPYFLIPFPFFEHIPRFYVEFIEHFKNQILKNQQPKH